MHEPIFVGLFWLALGGFLTIGAASYDLGELLQPGPGAYPLLLGLLMIILSLPLLFSGRGLKKGLKGQGVAPPSAASDGWQRVALIVLILILASLLFQVIGYLCTFFLMITCLMAVGSERKWKQILMTSFFSVLGVYLVFSLLLKQPLPTGHIGF